VGCSCMSPSAGYPRAARYGSTFHLKHTRVGFLQLISLFLELLGRCETSLAVRPFFCRATISVIPNSFLPASPQRGRLLSNTRRGRGFLVYWYMYWLRPLIHTIPKTFSAVLASLPRAVNAPTGRGSSLGTVSASVKGLPMITGIFPRSRFLQADLTMNVFARPPTPI